MTKNTIGNEIGMLKKSGAMGGVAGSDVDTMDDVIYQSVSLDVINAVLVINFMPVSLSANNKKRLSVAASSINSDCLP